MCPRFRGSHSTSWLLGRRFEPQGLLVRSRSRRRERFRVGARPTVALALLPLPNCSNHGDDRATSGQTRRWNDARGQANRLQRAAARASAPRWPGNSCCLKACRARSWQRFCSAERTSSTFIGCACLRCAPWVYTKVRCHRAPPRAAHRVHRSTLRRPPLLRPL